MGAENACGGPEAPSALGASRRIAELQNEVLAHVGAMVALAKIELHKREYLQAYIRGQREAAAVLFAQCAEARQLVREALSALEQLDGAGELTTKLRQAVRGWNG